MKNTKKEDVHVEINEGDVMVGPDGVKAIQWPFVGRAIMNRLDREIRRKIFVEVAAPLVLEVGDGSSVV